jgi:hypothetical protein
LVRRAIERKKWENGKADSQVETERCNEGMTAVSCDEIKDDERATAMKGKMEKERDAAVGRSK